VVLSSTKAATTTKVTSSKACVEIGSTATLNAQINGDYATGTLTFSAVGYTIGTASVTANAGTGLSSILPFTLSAVGAPAGSYVLEGSYGGDGNNAASSGTVPVVLMPASPVSMTANPMTVASGGNVTFTAMVGCSGAVPTGTVKFEYSGINLEQVTLANGVGISEAFNSTGYPAGQYQIYAVYSGDANYPAATSAAITITLQ
jgi:hypothetical protein